MKQNVTPHLKPFWVASGTGEYGISDLFLEYDPNNPTIGKCGDSCHNAGSSASAAHYTHCGNCHAGVAVNQAGAGVYPEWLRFNTPESLRASSYYAPGYTKGEAALFRALDGTMPPARFGDTELAAARPSVWCDEIVANYRTWLDNGQPLVAP